MNRTFNPSRGPEAKKLIWHRPGHEFDQGGRRTTLQEMIDLGGFFPLAYVADRSPFPMSTLRTWAKKGPYISCFEVVRKELGGRTTLVLVDLQRLARTIDAQAQVLNPPGTDGPGVDFDLEFTKEEITEMWSILASLPTRPNSETVATGFSLDLDEAGQMAI